jgi:mannonate dehydratase
VIATAPAGLRLTVVKILTDQDGLYGYGCGTFTQRTELVHAAVERYLKPILIGKHADRIEDVWQACYNSSYWRNGPVLNNAISGVDQALWDIKRRQAGMPVYQLAGGKCREAPVCYAHASGEDIPRCIESARRLIAQGFRHVRIQVGVPGMASYGPSGRCGHEGSGAARRAGIRHRGAVSSDAEAHRGNAQATRRRGRAAARHARAIISRCSSPRPLSRTGSSFSKTRSRPEDIAYFRQIRQNCATPIAMGELFNSPHEWTPLVSERLIDYIRIQVSQAGGFTPCRKVPAMAEIFGVRTAWHGPGDVSPVGHMANVTLDAVCYNFGIQEYTPFDDRLQEVFHGCPVLNDGYLYPNEAPGWGIEVDEKAAAKYPYGTDGARARLNGGWGEVRKPDGTIVKQ